jgi:ferredoxin--NADP+ reductase
MADRLRVAVVGAGPSGIYCAEGLVKHPDIDAHVDVIDRLPAPYGLLRYGVAPDHLKIKALTAAMARVFERPEVRFLGGVELGSDVTARELLTWYDAVVYAVGAPADRRLGLPGEDLPGSIAAGDLVSWYSGHPDAAPVPVSFHGSTAVVFGMGNVALDVARMLTKSPDLLRHTDVPDHILEALAQSKVRDVHIVGRRGPVEAKFSTKELRELDEVDGVQLLAVGDELRVADPDAVEGEPARNLELFRAWAERDEDPDLRHIRFRFGLQPEEFVGSDALEGVRLLRAAPDAEGAWVPTGEHVHIEAQLAVRSIGYRGVATADVPFDERRCLIPNEAGRVLGGPPGQYVVGWAKRGPTGVIGTNKADAQETVATLLADREQLPSKTGDADDDAILAALRERDVVPVTWVGWQGIEAAEKELGARRGANRVKIHDRDGLFAAAVRGAQSP